ncbi:Glycosyl transferase family 2 [anaerobic digester metagenome]
MEPKVSIIILNWNGWKDTLECIESLYQTDYSNYDVIIVDNYSKDDSINKIKAYCEGKLDVNSQFFCYDEKSKPIKIFEYLQEELKFLTPNKEISHIPSNKKLTIIKNNANYGFAEGNNIGIRYVLKSFSSDYILLLNNDTVVDKKFLNELLKVAKNDEKIGFLGPKTYYYNYNGDKNVINFAGGKLNIKKGKASHLGLKEIDNNQHNEIKKVDYIEGSCLLIKRNVLEEIGLLDLNYFAYWEEIDLCIRGLKEGYISIYVPKSKIWHKVSQSVNNEIKTYYLNRNRIWFMKKYSNRNEYLFFRLYLFMYEFWRELCVYIIYFQDLKKTKCFLKSIKDGFKLKSG